MEEQQLLVSRIKALAEALEESEVGELELVENGMRILIRRRSEAGAEAAMPVESVPLRSAHAAHRASARRPRPKSADAPAPAPGMAVVAPLTGVFYSSPSPSSASFVEVGDVIQAGQVVCILEAMKVFNEIQAEVSGTVTAILPKNGQLVQKGEALIRVKPV
ncbi:MAG TPA: acetyl-CoA carboxylase biotin carboxyl carrier protein [Ktedonobacterales bacterium]|nr:acetyl-CoA carboxylase biotin carboxyl carrier protein [Ktedonobacterales bacterium]